MLLTLSLQIYEEKFMSVCKKVFEFGMKEHERRMKEVEEFHTCLAEAKEENKKLSSKLVDAFEGYRKKVCVVTF